jgi:hypothetical protein
MRAKNLREHLKGPWNLFAIKTNKKYVGVNTLYCQESRQENVKESLLVVEKRNSKIFVVFESFVYRIAANSTLV